MLGKKIREKKRSGGGKNRRNKKRVKPDWECLPRVVRVTLNYKWSHFPSQNTQPQYNTQGAFPLAGQFTAPHGWAVASNLSSSFRRLCPSPHLFRPWSEGFCKLLVHNSLQRVTVFKYSLFPPFKPSLNLLFRQEKKTPHVWSLSMHSCPSFFCNLQNLSAFLFTLESHSFSFHLLYLLLQSVCFLPTQTSAELTLLSYFIMHITETNFFKNTKLEDGLFVYTISMRIFRHGATRGPNN